MVSTHEIYYLEQEKFLELAYTLKQVKDALGNYQFVQAFAIHYELTYARITIGMVEFRCLGAWITPFFQSSLE